ncbi:MAG: hypothetical protein K2X81_19710, partial [Candidatus Obscuribacterales bacterium]|nr:hypothetical protein [Candidatus Obscuribacterales bacterium]
MNFEELDEKKSIVSREGQQIELVSGVNSAETTGLSEERKSPQAEEHVLKRAKAKNLKLSIIPGGYAYLLAVLTVLVFASQIQLARADVVYFISHLISRPSSSGDAGLRMLADTYINLQDKTGLDALFDKVSAKGCSLGGNAERPLAEIDAILDLYGDETYNQNVVSRLQSLLPKLTALNALQPALKPELFARHPRAANALLTWARAVKKDIKSEGGALSLAVPEQNEIMIALYECLLANWQYQAPWDTASNIRSDLGEIYESQNRFAMAYELFVKAYELRKNFGDVDYNAYRLAHIGGNLLGMGRVAEGRKALLDAQAMAERLHFSGLDYLHSYLDSRLRPSASAAYPHSSMSNFHNKTRE